VELDVSFQASSPIYLRAQFEVSMEVYSECTGEHLERLLECISQAGWEYTIESNWEHTVKQAGSAQLNKIESIHQIILRNLPYSASGCVLSGIMKAA